MADERGWLSGEHVSVDSTLIRAWAEQRGFNPYNNSDGVSVDFHNQARSKATNASTAAPDACLYRKGKAASGLDYVDNTLADNRHGLVAKVMVVRIDGYAWHEAAKLMVVMPDRVYPRMRRARQAPSDAPRSLSSPEQYPPQAAPRDRQPRIQSPSYVDLRYRGLAEKRALPCTFRRMPS